MAQWGGGVQIYVAVAEGSTAHGNLAGLRWHYDELCDDVGMCVVYSLYAALYSLALLSARVFRLLEMSRLLKRHTTFASTFPLAVCKEEVSVGRSLKYWFTDLLKGILSALMSPTRGFYFSVTAHVWCPRTQQHLPTLLSSSILRMR